MTFEYPITPEQRERLARMNRAPWRWFFTDAAYFKVADRYQVDAMRRWWSTVSRTTRYTGPDYRVRFAGQQSWIRASRLQYEQAETQGLEHSIGVPQ